MRVLLTNRALLDVVSIESYSIENFGVSVAAQYLSKLEAGISRISDYLKWSRDEKHQKF